MRRHPSSFPSARSQQGAALYVALIMLLLLALIGIVGMQVAGMQEKMSANYRNVNLAFQNAEAQARQAECSVEAQVNRTAVAGCGATNVEQMCDNGFDATSWAAQRAMDDPLANTQMVRSVGKCISGNSSLAMGVQPESEDPNPVFQISAYATDYAANPSADAAVDTIFRP
ncbi:pilus assembly PilX family protein [Pseudoxanthomonas putridarboris]|uniref:PilX N-terminal domain-containing pilus assembly protein n=1 Tax=Pseudoxanthomonas putridarboris TaxID=752605 RepID=A0ABU9IZ41_9GAMM